MFEELMIKFSSDASSFFTGLEEVKEKLESFDKAVKAGKHEGGLLGGAVMGGAALAFAVAEQAVEKFVEVMKETIGWGAKMAVEAQKANVSIDFFHKLSASAEDFDISSEAVGKGLKKLQKSMASAAGGNDKMIDSFSKLGVTQDMLKSGNTEQVFFKIADALKESNGDLQTLDASLKVVKNGFDLIAMAKMGSEELKSEMGHFSTIDENAAASMRQNKKTVDEFEDYVKVKFVSVAAAVIYFFQLVTQELGVFFQRTAQVTEVTCEFIKGALKSAFTLSTQPYKDSMEKIHAINEAAAISIETIDEKIKNIGLGKKEGIKETGEDIEALAEKSAKAVSEIEKLEKAIDELNKKQLEQKEEYEDQDLTGEEKAKKLMEVVKQKIAAQDEAQKEYDKFRDKPLLSTIETGDKLDAANSNLKKVTETETPRIEEAQKVIEHQRNMKLMPIAPGEDMVKRENAGGVIHANNEIAESSERIKKAKEEMEAAEELHKERLQANKEIGMQNQHNNVEQAAALQKLHDAEKDKEVYLARLVKANDQNRKEVVKEMSRSLKDEMEDKKTLMSLDQQKFQAEQSAISKKYAMMEDVNELARKTYSSQHMIEVETKRLTKERSEDQKNEVIQNKKDELATLLDYARNAENASERASIVTRAISIKDDLKSSGVSDIYGGNVKHNGANDELAVAFGVGRRDVAAATDPSAALLNVAVEQRKAVAGQLLANKALQDVAVFMKDAFKAAIVH